MKLASVWLKFAAVLGGGGDYGIEPKILLLVVLFVIFYFIFYFLRSITNQTGCEHNLFVSPLLWYLTVSGMTNVFDFSLF